MSHRSVTPGLHVPSASRTVVDETLLKEPLPQAVGVVDTLWRYPVKSMRGERMSELAVGPRGVVGDRAWALRDTTTGRIASAKTFPRLLEFHARYVVEPSAGRSGNAVITLPNGDEIAADDPSLSAVISHSLGRDLQLESEPLADEKTTINRANGLRGRTRRPDEA